MVEQYEMIDSQETSNNPTVKHYMSHVMRKPVFAYAKTKTQISQAVSAWLISTFVFAT